MTRKALTVAIAVLIGALGAPAGGATSPAPREARTTRRAPVPDDLFRALGSGRITKASYALERARSLFQLNDVRDRYGEVHKPHPHDATPLLRELAQNLHSLDGKERRTASRILARPTDGVNDPQLHGYEPTATLAVPDCRTKTNDHTSKSMKVCFHWVTDTADATQQSYIDAAWIYFDEVWETEINDLGFRSPLKDAGAPDNGPNRGLDIYFADVGADGVYGYCTNDDPRRSSRTQSAYCVIDNDFAEDEFAPGTFGSDALQVTLAHEFFHTSQFAYDWLERLFFMEGTAVWIEDEVFDDVDVNPDPVAVENPNYDYLHDSALHQPEVPLDAGDYRPDENFEYGAWLFFRFLSERFDAGVVVRDLWETATSSNGLASLRQVLNRRNSNLPSAYAGFAEWNRVIDDNNYGLERYSEGIDYMNAVNYRYPPTDAEFWVGHFRTRTGPRSLRLNHLSMRYVLFQPDSFSILDGTRLRVRIAAEDVPGARVRIIRLTANDPNDDFILDQACESIHKVRLNRDGVGVKSVPFYLPRCNNSTWEYSFVYLTLVNGGGKDNARFEYSARTIAP